MTSAGIAEDMVIGKQLSFIIRLVNNGRKQSLSGASSGSVVVINCQRRLIVECQTTTASMLVVIIARKCENTTRSDVVVVSRSLIVCSSFKRKFCGMISSRLIDSDACHKKGNGSGEVIMWRFIHTVV
jgi:hypothetical protein